MQWESIPPPFRQVSVKVGCDTVVEGDVFGILPLDHPKRVNGKAKWIDRKLLTPTLGSECRLVFGKIVLMESSYNNNFIYIWNTFQASFIFSIKSQNTTIYLLLN